MPIFLILPAWPPKDIGEKPVDGRN